MVRTCGFVALRYDSGLGLGSGLIRACSRIPSIGAKAFGPKDHTLHGFWAMLSLRVIITYTLLGVPYSNCRIIYPKSLLLIEAPELGELLGCMTINCRGPWYPKP